MLTLILAIALLNEAGGQTGLQLEATGLLFETHTLCMDEGDRLAREHQKDGYICIPVSEEEIMFRDRQRS